MRLPWLDPAALHLFNNIISFHNLEINAYMWEIWQIFLFRNFHKNSTFCSYNATPLILYGHRFHQLLSR